MTYGLSAGISVRAWNLATASVAALTMLTVVAALTPAVAQQPDPAAAQKARCDPLMAEYRSISGRAAAPKALTEQFNSAVTLFNQKKKEYNAIRDSGDHVRAWQMTATIDNLWARMKSTNDALVAARSARLDARRASCAVVSRLVASGCAKPESITTCTTLVTNVEGDLGRARARVAGLSKTWKTAADEKLNPANAAKGCPIAKTIAPRATLTFVSGRVFIVRGVRTIPAATGMTLHPGDVVAVEEGSQATLDFFGGGLIKISEKTKFEIFNPADSDSPPRHQASLFFGGIWTKAKQLIQGQEWKLKECTDSGRRG